MQSALKTEIGKDIRRHSKRRAVIVIEGDGAELSGAVDRLLLLRAVDGLRVSAIGYADETQYREIVRVLAARRCVLPQ